MDLTLLRVKLIIEYDGTPFAGWQRQRELLSVQECLENAILKFTGGQVTTFAAGRTDAGVHALGQVVHFDLAKNYQQHEIMGAINYYLRPHPVTVIAVEFMDTNFHARFSASQREYIFRILNRPAPSALLNNRAWHVREKLSSAQMHEAAQILVGKHDFSSFRAARCQSASPVKNITSIEVKQQQEEITVHISAPSFLHNQVRIIVGALKKIGDGSWDTAKLQEVLAAKDRRAAAETAPACGLYFLKVSY